MKSDKNMDGQFSDKKDLINKLRKKIKALESLNEKLRSENIEQKENEQLFYQFFKQCPVHLFIKDHNLQVLKLSESFENMLGIPADLVVGKKMNEIFPSEFAKKINSDDKKVLRDSKKDEFIEDFNGSKYLTVKFPLKLKDKPAQLAGITIDFSKYYFLQEALMESRKRYSELLELAVDGILIGSKDGFIINANTTICKMTGRKRNELIGKHISDSFFSEESISEKPFQFDELRNGKVVVNDRIILRPDGSIVPVEMRTKMMPDGTFQSIYRDITKRLQAEETIRKSEEKYRLIFEHSPLGILHYDNKGVIIACNDSFVRIIGSSQKEIVKLNMCKLPDKKLVNVVRKSLKGTTATYEDVYHSFTSNKITPVKAFFAPARDDKGDIIGGIGIVEDISESFLSERKLRQSENLNLTLVEHLPQRIFLKDTDSVYISCNQNYATDLGISKDEIAGKTDIELYPEEMANSYRFDDMEVIRTGRIKKIEEKYILNGNERWAYTVKLPFKDADDNIIGVIGVYEDITDEKNAEQQLLNLSADKDRFISILSHDLKSPFNSLIALSKLLTNNIHNCDLTKIDGFLKQFSKSAQSTYELMEELLAWARAQSGKMSFKPQYLNFSDLCEDIFDSFICNPNYSDIKITYTGQKELLVFADPDMLKTIMRNLISNALKFILKDGKVIIDAICNKGRVLITVKDNGIGIEPDDIKKLFDVMGVRTIPDASGDKGTGFGLLLCKEFVEKHNGTIWVESEHGKGSEFKISLPLPVN